VNQALQADPLDAIERRRKREVPLAGLRSPRSERTVGHQQALRRTRQELRGSLSDMQMCKTENRDYQIDNEKKSFALVKEVHGTKMTDRTPTNSLAEQNESEISQSSSHVGFIGFAQGGVQSFASANCRTCTEISIIQSTMRCVIGSSISGMREGRGARGLRQEIRQGWELKATKRFIS
jgi:hypothetical protein